MDTMNSLPASRMGSVYGGSRPTSPHINRDTIRREKEAIYGQYNDQQQHRRGEPYAPPPPPPQQQQQYRPPPTNPQYESGNYSAV